MHLKDYSVVISEGVETSEGYVKMSHGSQYVIRVRNRKGSRCNAAVMVDGKEIGTFRLNGYGHLELERPPDDTGRFTFYRLGSNEARQAGLGNVNKLELGLIQVTFTPEKPPVSLASWSAPYAEREVTRRGMVGSLGEPEASVSFGATPAGAAAGGTGLSGHSNQGFVNVASMNLDYDNAVTISLRLIADDDIRPLKPVSSNQTLVPPPVE